jgi:3-hydroxyacyl-CoA dehydrogenase
MRKEYQTLIIYNIGGVKIIKLNTPPLNLFGKKLRVEIVDAIEDARIDDNIKGVVLTSSTTFFSGGADITEFDSGDLEPTLPYIIDNIEAFSKPFIVAVNGPAFGGGCEISLGTHRRLMTPNATFSLPEVKLGILPGGGGTQRMPRLISPVIALDLIIKGGIINAKD